MRILPLKSQYVYSLMMFVIKNRDTFVINKDYHEVNTRQNINLHMYQVNLTKYGKGVYHMAVKVFNGLPCKLKVMWRVSPMRELLKRGASNQARNRKRTSCYAKHATVEREATPRSLLRNTEVKASLRQLVATQQ
jgi:hypothetical protein